MNLHELSLDNYFIKFYQIISIKSVVFHTDFTDDSGIHLSLTECCEALKYFEIYEQRQLKILKN